MKKIPQDIIGDIAILKFPRSTWWIKRKFLAWRFLKANKNVNVVLEKVAGFSGELRTLSAKWLSGEKRFETYHNELGCKFFLNVNETYFSPRLSNERKLIAEAVVKSVKKTGSRILVCFAGVSPYPIIISKFLKKAGKKAEIISNELNEKANEFAAKNLKLNKINDVTLVGGDANTLPRRLKGMFDVIVMPRPNLDDTFLKAMLKLSKKGTKIFYHGFGTRDEVLSEIERDAKGKIGKVKIRAAGDIGKGKWRWLAEFMVK